MSAEVVALPTADWRPHTQALAVSYAKGLMRAYRAGFAAAKFPNPRCIYANPNHVQAWRQGLADGLEDLLP